jgi:hypothetical protein
MFGIAVGLGGDGVAVGLPFTLADIPLASYSVAQSILLAAAMSMSLGLTRIFPATFMGRLVSFR